MRFSVSVPVLSVQIRVVAPSVSTAAKPLDDDVPLRHAPHAAGKCHGGHDRQSLRDGGDGERNARLDHEHEVAACGHAGGGNESGDNEGGLDELPRKIGELALERGDVGLGLDHEPCDQPKLGGHAGRNYDARAACRA